VDSRPSGRRRWGLLRPAQWAVLLTVYVVLFTCLGLVASTFGADPWSWIAPGIGGLVGLLLLNAPPVRRLLPRQSADRGAGPPQDVGR
jgi:hypothetical protein